MDRCDFHGAPDRVGEAQAFAAAFVRVFGDGARPAQVRVADSILEHTYASELRVGDAQRSSTCAISALVRSEAQRQLLIDLLILVQMCARSCAPRPLHARSLSRFADALAIEEGQVRVANLAALGCYDEMEREWSRLREAPRQGEALVRETPAARERLRGIGACAPGSLGRAIYDFCNEHEVPVPGEPDYGHLRYVQHDAHHVLTGYGTTGPEEIALQALLVSAEQGRECSRLTGLLGLYELGRMEPCFPGLEAQRGCATSQHGRTLIAQALRRGAGVRPEICDLDVLASLDEPLQTLQRRFGIESLEGTGSRN